MKSILQPIKPKYCELIAVGLKTKEVRKTKPKLPTPFKVYIYQSKHKWPHKIFERLGLYQGKVIGEYVCNRVEEIIPERYPFNGEGTCLTNLPIMHYGEIGLLIFGTFRSENI